MNKCAGIISAAVLSVMMLTTGSAAMAAPLPAAPDLPDFSVAPVLSQPDLQKSIPSKLKAVHVTTRCATLKWDADGLFNNYTIYQYDFILDAWTEVTNVRVSEFELNDLSPGMFYKFKIAVPSANGLQESIVGDVAFYTKPEKPQLTLDAYGATCAKLQLAGKKTPAYYELYRKKGNGEYEKIAKISGEQTEYEDTELTPKTEYTYKLRSVIENKTYSTKSSFSAELTLKTGNTMKLPKVSGACKTYAYYTAVTDKTSPAYAVLNSGTYNGVKYETYTDEETGIRMVDDCYCAALGTYYGTEKGTKYRVTLKSGATFKIILCDTKSNRHTDKKHQYARKNKDVVEFYVDKDKIPANINGNYNRLEQFHGAIQSIERISEIQTDADDEQR